MNRRLEPVVRQPAQQISDIDHQSALDGRRIKPFAVHGEHLQAAGHVLPEECETLDVGVRSNAGVDVVLLVLWRTGVVDEDRVRAWVRCDGVEVVFGEIQGEGEDADHLAGELQAKLPELD